MAEVVKMFEETISHIENLLSPHGTTLHTIQLQGRDVTPGRLETSQMVWKHILPPVIPESGAPKRANPD